MSQSVNTETGILYIVATPIGNLSDITQRALNVLQDVDLIAAEDTRHSARLLQHYNISSKTVAIHEHNEEQKSAWVLQQLQSGKSIALISDAGTPLISDPGYQLVNVCRQAGVSVVPIPGACAVIAALCASGLATDAFQFIGFLPVKAQAKQNVLKSLETARQTSIMYEAPRRVKDTLLDMQTLFAEDRKIVLAKELTKSFERFVSGTVAEVLDWLTREPQREKGEFVILVSPAEKRSDATPPEALALLEELLPLLPAKKAAAVVAKHYDLKKNDLYKVSLELKDAGS